MRNGVLIQKGHLTNYGAEVGQGIGLSGAKIISCGLKNSCSDNILEEALIKNKQKFTFLLLERNLQYRRFRSVPNFEVGKVLTISKYSIALVSLLELYTS